jgi:hypothetical protein
MARLGFASEHEVLEAHEQESQNQSSFKSLRQVKRKMARLGFASAFCEVLGAKRAGIPEPIIF